MEGDEKRKERAARKLEQQETEAAAGIDDVRLRCGSEIIVASRIQCIWQDHCTAGVASVFIMHVRLVSFGRVHLVDAIGDVRRCVKAVQTCKTRRGWVSEMLDEGGLLLHFLLYDTSGHHSLATQVAYGHTTQ